MKYSLIKHEFLYVWFYWINEPEFNIKEVGISFENPILKGSENFNPEADKIKEQIFRYLDGSLDKLPIDQLDLSLLSTFAKKVLCELRKSVKRGETVSYGELAKFAGSPGAARAVGSVMRNNPFPLFFPCHRVIKSNGDFGLFQGSATGTKLKKQILKLENY